MRHLFVLVLLLSPVTRFPGFLELVASIKGALAFVALASWLLLGRRDDNAGLERTFLGGGVGRPPWVPPLPWLSGLFVALLAWTVLALCVSTVPASRGLPVLLAQLSVVAFFYPFFAMAAEGPQRSWPVVQLFVAGAVGVSCLAALQYVVAQFGVLPFLMRWIIPKLDRDLLLAGGPEALPEWGYRSWGTFHHPNLLGSFLAMALPLAVVLAVGAKDRRQRALSLLAVLLVVVGIFCSGSRGGWLNAGIGIAVLTLLWARRLPKVLWWAAGTVTPLVGWIFHGQLRQYLRLDNVLSNRDIIWRNTCTLIAERPLFGWGPGAFSRTYLDRFDFPTYIERGTAMRELESLGRIHLLDYWHAHNFFLHLGAELGLAAPLLAAVIFIVYFRTLLRSGIWRSSTPDRNALLALGCSAAVAGNLVHSFLETTINFNDPALGIPFIFVFANGLAAMRRQEATTP